MVARQLGVRRRQEPRVLECAGGAIYGVAFYADGTFEVVAVDDGDPGVAPDGVLRFIAMPGGAKPVEFRARMHGTKTVMFENRVHDFPKRVTYLREADELRASVAGGDKSLRFVFRRAAAGRSPELEAADRAFSADTVARGIDGWVAAFAPDGVLVVGNELATGPEAVRAAMQPLLRSGKLEWAPLASGRSGDLGFTIGTAQYTGERSFRTSYATIWAKQPDGTWKVRFDVGRPIYEPKR